MRDFKKLSSDPPGGISGAPCADNIMVWNAVIFGPGASPSRSRPAACRARRRELTLATPPLLHLASPAPLGHPFALPALLAHAPLDHLDDDDAAETPFEDGTFRLVLTFDESYPNKPPVVKFLSKMFHPNVYANGELCLDILQNRWSPTYDVAAILTSIQSLLHDPNPNRCVSLVPRCTTLPLYKASG